MISALYIPPRHEAIWARAKDVATQLGTTRNELIMFLLAGVEDGSIAYSRDRSIWKKASRLSLTDGLERFRTESKRVLLELPRREPTTTRPSDEGDVGGLGI